MTRTAYPEPADYIPISVLQHFTYCERRAALVHIERIWSDNQFTAEGVLLHQRVDKTGRAVESRGRRRMARRLTVWSRRLAIAGVADLVEFERTTTSPDQEAWSLIRPVEYKRSARQAEAAYEVQLCAQGLCLEEMFGVPVLEGVLYAGTTRDRRTVVFDVPLRTRVESVIAAVQALRENGRTPRARRGPQCRPCSLRDRCRPELLSDPRRASTYVDALVCDLDGTATAGDGP
jgi:CRISPR-associated exonuclease Cas4